MSTPPEEYVSSYQKEPFGSSFVHMVKEKPLVITGLTGMIGVVAYGYRRYKTQGFLVSPSLFLMQLRVAAQSAVVGILTIGMVYSMVDRHILNKKPKD